MKRILITIICLAVIVFTPASVCYADQADPDSTPVVEIDVWRNNLETGDILVLIYANTPYASTPDATFSEAFIWRLIDTDNVTELGSTVGYSYDTNGYGYNVFAMYFSAADNLTWGSDYIIRLSGNPLIFDDPPVYNYAIEPSDYSPLTTSASVKEALAVRILYIASELDNHWGLTATTSLLLEVETGTVLSIYGEAFFRTAIYGLQGLAPALFRFSVGDIEVTDRTWTDAYTTNLTGMYSGTWVETAQTGGADLAGTSYDWTTLLLCVGLCAVTIFFGMNISGGDTWAGMIDGGIVLLGFSRIAFIDPTFLGFITAMCWVYVSAKIWSVIR